MTDFLGVIAPPVETVETTVHGAPVIYDNPPAGVQPPGANEPVNGDVDPFTAAHQQRGDTDYHPAAPLPILPTVPLGGVVLDAGRIAAPAATTVVATIGDAGSQGRPDVVGILLVCTAGAGSVEIMPDNGKDSLGLGFILPLFAATTLPTFLPIRRANVRLTGAVTLAFLVIGSGLNARG